MSDAFIANGHIIDPANNIDEVGNLLIADGRIRKHAGLQTRPTPSDSHSDVYDATGLIVAPGLIDMHVHLREPGFEHKETIATGTAAAAAGGFTSVACMANTSPVIDTPEKIEQIYDIAAETAATNVFPFGSITKDLAGNELTDMRGMRSAGAVGFSDDGRYRYEFCTHARRTRLERRTRFPDYGSLRRSQSQCRCRHESRRDFPKVRSHRQPKRRGGHHRSTRHHVSRDDRWTSPRASR